MKANERRNYDGRRDTDCGEMACEAQDTLVVSEASKAVFVGYGEFILQA
jgi:hypothetical protein